MRRLSHLTLFIATVPLGFAFHVSAQQPAPVPVNPPMTSSYMDKEKSSLYARFLEYKRSRNPEQQRYAYPTAKEYLLRWGGEQDAETKEVWGWLIAYERAMHAGELYAAYDKKNYVKTFEIGRPLVKTDTGYFLGLAILTQAGYENALSGNASLNAEAADYARRAIALVEAGKVSSPEPFKTMDVARGFLNYALGTFVSDDKPAEAATAFAKAVKSDSPFHTEPAAYQRLGLAILKGEFAQLSTEYNQTFGGKPSSPEQAAMLGRINHLVDQTIDAYARAVALSTRPEQQATRAKILGQLTALYKNFHNNSDEGLQELVATVLSKPMP